MAQIVSTEPSSRVPALLLAAHVSEVQEDADFQASVYRAGPLGTPVVRLNLAIRDSAHEGRVFRWALECVISGRPGYFEYTALPGGYAAR